MGWEQRQRQRQLSPLSEHRAGGETHTPAGTFRGCAPGQLLGEAWQVVQLRISARYPILKA